MGISTKPGRKQKTTWRVVNFLVLFSFVAGTFIVGGISIYSSIHQKTPPEAASPSTNLAGSDNNVKKWEEDVKAAPNDAFALRQLAEALAEEGKIAEARIALERAIKVSPDNYLNYELAGKFNFVEKKFPLAAQDFQKALSMNPDNPDLEIELANIDVNLGEKKKAKALLEDVLRQASSSHDEKLKQVIQDALKKL